MQQTRLNVPSVFTISHDSHAAKGGDVEEKRWSWLLSQSGVVIADVPLFLVLANRRLASCTLLTREARMSIGLSY